MHGFSVPKSQDITLTASSPMITDMTLCDRFERDVRAMVPRLKQGSGGNWTGNCPSVLHNDKKASFSVHFQKRLFVCFGCDWKGNSYQFAREFNMSHANIYLDSPVKNGVSSSHPTPNKAKQSEAKHDKIVHHKKTT